VISRRPIRQECSQPRPELQSVCRIDKLVELSNLRTILCKGQDKCIFIPIRTDRRRRRTACMYDTSVRLGVMRLLEDCGL
jgi:hypothetical protein